MNCEIVEFCIKLFFDYSSFFEGLFCQKNIDGCLSNPCLNGGICNDNIDGFSCNCTDRWMGLTCEKSYDICEFYPCKNNGTCRSSVNKREYTCQCLSGFDGDNCELNIEDCPENKVYFKDIYAI